MAAGFSTVSRTANSWPGQFQVVSVRSEHMTKPLFLGAANAAATRIDCTKQVLICRHITELMVTKERQLSTGSLQCRSGHRQGWRLPVRLLAGGSLAAGDWLLAT